MSLAELLAPVWAELGSIKKRLPSVSPATVTSVDPVRIQVDGQGAPVAASPDTLVPVGPGDRVRVLRYGTTHLIIGVNGGTGKPWRTAAGIAEIPASSEPVLSVRVDFPQGRFTQAPIVVATPGNGAYAGFAHLVTSNGANVGSRRIAGETVAAHTIYWHAIQMTPTSADG